MERRGGGVPVPVVRILFQRGEPRPGWEFGSAQAPGTCGMPRTPRPFPTVIPCHNLNPEEAQTEKLTEKLPHTHTPPKNTTRLLAPLAPQHIRSIMRLYKVFYYSEGVGMIPLRFNYGI